MGKDLRVNAIARAGGQEIWTIVGGDRYRRERFRQLAIVAGQLLSPGSSDPLADWLGFVREQPASDWKETLTGVEYDEDAPENTSVRITCGSIYEVVMASELAAAAKDMLEIEAKGEPTARETPGPGRQPKASVNANARMLEAVQTRLEEVGGWTCKQR